MTLKRIIIIGLCIAAITLFSGCTLRKTGEAGEWEQYGTKGPKKIGLVLSAAEKEGSNTYEVVSAAANKAALEQGAQYRVLMPGDLVNDEEALRYLAENQFDLILTLGKGIEKDLTKAAAAYPDIKFAVIGGEVDSANVTSIRFDKSEGAFLAGILAASLTNTQNVGFIGVSEGADRETQNGFVRGVQYINLVEGKKIKVTAAYAGVTSAAGTDPERGRTLANNLYLTGSDIIFCVPGKIANGAVTSAAENRRIAITSDVKLLTEFPWNVYGAVIDKQENAVYDLVRKALAGKLTGGRTGLGVAEGAVDISVSVNAPEEIKVKLNAVRVKLKNGQIKPYTIIIPKDMVNEVSQIPVDWNKPQSNAGDWGRNRSGGNAGGTQEQNQSGGSTWGSQGQKQPGGGIGGAQGQNQSGGSTWGSQEQKQPEGAGGTQGQKQPGGGTGGTQE